MGPPAPMRPPRRERRASPLWRKLPHGESSRRLSSTAGVLAALTAVALGVGLSSLHTVSGRRHNTPSPPQCFGRAYPVQGPALRAIYWNLGGDTWTHTHNWTTQSNVCAFDGVGCDQDCHAEELSLPNNNLHGSLFAGIFDNLTHLSMLDLSENMISGTLPSGLFARNTELSQVVMSHNQLSGSIPADLGLTSTAAHLHFDDNKLVGSLPDGFFDLPALQVLALGANSLVGTLPRSLDAMPHLISVTLASNHFSGSLPDFSNNTKLQTVDMSFNSLGGTLPDMAQLSKLRVLRLDHNGIEGTFPDELPYLPAIHIVSLTYNRLSCALPAINASAFQLVAPGDLSVLEGNLFACPIPEALFRSDPAASTYYCGMGLELYLSPAVCLLFYVVGVMWHAWPWGRYRTSGHLTADEAAMQITAMGELGPGTEAVTYLRFSRMAIFLAASVAALCAGMMSVYDDSTAEYECRGVMEYTAAFITGEGTLTFVPMMLHVVLVLGVLYWLVEVRRQRWAIWGDGARASTTRSLSDRIRQVTLGSSIETSPGGSARRTQERETITTLCRDLQIVVAILVILALLAAPHMLYVLSMNSYSLSVGVKRFASVVLAFVNAFATVVMTPGLASWIVDTLGKPGLTLKHSFEFKVRLAGLLTVAATCVAPVAAVMLFDRSCFWDMLDPPPDTVVTVPERICEHVSNFTTGKCDKYEFVTYELTLKTRFHYDERCPSHVLYLYGVVFMHTMIVQGLFATGVKLMQDTALGRRVSSGVVGCLRRMLCMKKREVPFGVDSSNFLKSLLSKYNQIVAVMSVTLVYGSLYPPVAFVACVATIARTYADARLVRRGMATGAHQEWEPQGARGLPMTSFVVVLFAYAGFVAWFYGLGLVDTSKYPIGYVLMIIVAVGLVMLRLRVFENMRRCLRKVNAVVNHREYQESPMMNRRHSRGGHRRPNEMGLLSDYDAKTGSGEIPTPPEWEGDVHDDIARVDSGGRRASTGSAGSAKERVRRLSSGSDDGSVDDSRTSPGLGVDREDSELEGFRADRDDSLRGVGGRPLIRGDYAPRTSSRRPASGASARHREQSGTTGVGAWGGPSPYLGTVVEPKGASKRTRWRVDSPLIPGGSGGRTSSAASAASAGAGSASGVGSGGSGISKARAWLAVEGSTSSLVSTTSATETEDEEDDE